ncbi:endonuclease III domain-containing protein [Thermoproteota archaeon]
MMINKIYNTLYKKYGPQGWWPLLAHKGINPTKTGSVTGYHPGDYSFPHTPEQKFEICCGAILTQNTSWPQVEKALQNLRRINSLSVKGIKKLSDGKLKEMIKPAGYYNQKADYLRKFIVFFEKLDGTPTRNELLAVKGVGEETADSILLYAFKQTEFVVDAYTRRVFSRIGLTQKDAKYGEIKEFFETGLDKDVELFQEYHALLVELAKQHCMTKPVCEGCPIRSMCKRSI